jgi:endonuclease/exonuclease/phosphatase (EEP) superfamily protein YafD
MRPRPETGAVLAGAAAALSVLALIGAIFAWAYPSGGVLAPVARLFDAFAPVLVFSGLVLGGAAAALGLRRIGPALVTVAIIAALIGVDAYRAVTLPPDDAVPADLRVLFYNAQFREAMTADAVVDEILEAEADVVVIAEAQEVAPARTRLEAAYGFVSPCPPEDCDLLVASRRPVRRFWRLELNPAWPPRYAVAEIELRSGETMFLSAVHLAKPWFSGLAESEIARLSAQYDWLEGPAVAVGDFNMPPWSWPMRRLLERTGFRAIRGQFGTWPRAAGTAGLPIDHVLVRDGIRVTALRPFGQDLTSNHRGFIADISVAPAVRP